MAERHVIEHDIPAVSWTSAYPLGNGRLGAMVYGRIGDELLRLNHDTFWSGMPRDTDLPGAAVAVQAARAALDHGDHRAAEEAVLGAQGRFVESYLPLADLSVRSHHDPDAPVTNYRRRLELERAVATTEYTVGGVAYRRDTFVSAPAGVMVVRIRCSVPGELRLTLGWDAPLATGSRSLTSDSAAVVVKAPVHVVPDYVDDPEPVRHDDRLGHGMYAAAVARVVSDGRVTSEGGSIEVTNATEVTVLVAAATGYRGPFRAPNRTVGECIDAAVGDLDRAARVGASALEQEHVAEHNQWYRRVDLNLGDGQTRPGSTPTLLRAAEDDERAAVELFERMFHFGRYLLIACSRPDSEPANLQGIWNRRVRPPWSSNFTLNINVQMNYWPAEPTGLPELHLPLLRFVEDLLVAGTRTAANSYGLPGWVAHHNSDIWRHTMSVGEASLHPMWVNWWMGGAWLSHHLWEHAAYSGEIADAARALPVLRGVARFLLAWLVDDGVGGLTTSPSTSPENTFVAEDGEPAAVTIGASMDLEIAAQVFDDLAAAAAATGDHEEVDDEARAARARLARPKIGSRGQLLEWAEEFTEAEPHHRHVSHLFGFYPGDVLVEDPELRDAALRSLDERKDLSTAWALAWRATLRARLGDGERAWSTLRLFASEITGETIGEEGGLYDGLLCAGPPFQIDGNMGIVAAVCQMVLDSRGDAVRVLPALPAAWASGRVRGLRARGGLFVDLTWSDSVLDLVTLRASRDGSWSLRYGAHSRDVTLSAGSSMAFGRTLSPADK